MEYANRRVTWDQMRMMAAYLRKTVATQHPVGGGREEEVNRVQVNFVNERTAVLGMAINGSCQEGKVGHREACRVRYGQPVVERSPTKVL